MGLSVSVCLFTYLENHIVRPNFTKMWHMAQCWRCRHVTSYAYALLNFVDMCSERKLYTGMMSLITYSNCLSWTDRLLKLTGSHIHSASDCVSQDMRCDYFLRHHVLKGSAETLVHHSIVCSLSTLCQMLLLLNFHIHAYIHTDKFI